MSKIILKNKEANFNFEQIKTYVAGIELFGWEVKSIREKNINLKGAFCSFKNGELFLINMHVGKYMHVEGDEKRTRKLLLNKNELKKIEFQKNTQNLIIVPKTILLKNNLIKLEIFLGKSKKKYDKRQIIKKRDEKRMIRKNF